MRKFLSFLAICILFMVALMSFIFSGIVGMQPGHHMAGIGLALVCIGSMVLICRMILRGALDGPAPLPLAPLSLASHLKRRHLHLVP